MMAEEVFDIHPYDMMELLNETNPVTLTFEEGSLIRLNGKLYKQTTTVPQKGNKIS